MDYPEYLHDKNLFDVGAYVGDSAVVLSRYTKGSIFCFEPVSFHANLIQQTLELNNITTSVIIEHLALGDCCGEVEIKGLFTGSSGASIVSSRQSSSDDASTKFFSEKTSLVTVDSYVAQKELSNVGLIKMDIEGAEKAAIIGAEKTIREFRPHLLISIYHTPDDFFDIKPMIESWNLGYKFKVRRCPGSLLADTMLIAEVPPESR